MAEFSERLQRHTGAAGWQRETFVGGGGRQRRKVQNVFTETKVNKRNMMDGSGQSEERRKKSELDTEMPSRSQANSFNSELIRFCKNKKSPTCTFCYFKRKYARLVWSLRTKKDILFAFKRSLYAAQKNGSFLKQCLWAIMMNFWANHFPCIIPEKCLKGTACN